MTGGWVIVSFYSLCVLCVCLCRLDSAGVLLVGCFARELSEYCLSSFLTPLRALCLAGISCTGCVRKEITAATRTTSLTARTGWCASISSEGTVFTETAAGEGCVRVSFVRGAGWEEKQLIHNPSSFIRF